MKSLLYISALTLMLSAFSIAAALAQSDVAGSVSGAPDSDPSLSRPARPPVTYSTPETETMKKPAAPQGVPQQDYEDLYFQKEMWRQYQEDYEMNRRPQPRDGR